VHSDGFVCCTQLRLGQEREAETIRRWCRRHLRIGRCDQRYSYFHFRETDTKAQWTLSQEWRILGLWSAAKKGPNRSLYQPHSFIAM
jgi:hypothetical protein